MKILMVLDHEFPPDVRVENEIEALSKDGHEIHLACYTFTKSSGTSFEKGFTIHRKKISTFLYKTSVGALKFPFYFNFWRKYLNQLFSENSYDAIHIHDLPLAKVGNEFASKSKIPLTIDLHENWPALLQISDHTSSFLGRLLSSDKQWRKYETEQCQKANNIIVVVEEAKKRLIDSGIDEQKIHVVSNTLNLEHFKLPETHPDKKHLNLLYAGGITRHRGLQYILKGIKLIKQNNLIRFWVLGSGSYMNQLKNIAMSEGLEQQVIFKGWLNYDDMQDFFGKSDICIIPHTKSDHTDSTIPHKLFQYMYAGKPVIASNCAPIERIINETKCGLTYKFDDPADFASQVNCLMNDPKLIEQMAKNGANAVIQKYNWNLDQKILIQIYS